MKFFETSKYNTLKKSTYVSLRWIGIIGQLSAINVVYFYFNFDFNFILSNFIVGLGILSNLYLIFVYKKTQLSDRSALLFLIIDIIQLGSSIDNKLRAPYRQGTQEYKYRFVRGACGLFCSSNMKYNIGIHGSINGVPPQVNCLENKPTFECHPNVNQVFQAIMKLYLENG